MGKGWYNYWFLFSELELFEMTTASVVTTTSHWAISFCSAWVIIWACVVCTLPHLKAKNSNEIPSNMIEIHIQTHAKFVAFLDTAVIIAKNTNIHHNNIIAHQNVWVSLFCIEKKINISNLISAQRANIHIVSLPINSDPENINKNQSNVIRTHIANNIDINLTCWFFIELITADIHEKTKNIHKIISKNFQNTPGAQTVIIQQTINVAANHNITQRGHSFFIL